MELDVGHPVLLPPGGGEIVGDSADRRVAILADGDELHVTWSRFGPQRDGASPHVHRSHSDAKARYEELGDDLCARNDDVEQSQMMGMPCVKRSGKIVAGFTRGAMVFKLSDPDAHARALSLPGAHLFDPSGKGQPFKEWVVVPETHADEWESLSQEALRPAG